MNSEIEFLSMLHPCLCPLEITLAFKVSAVFNYRKIIMYSCAHVEQHQIKTILSFDRPFSRVQSIKWDTKKNERIYCKTCFTHFYIKFDEVAIELGLNLTISSNALNEKCWNLCVKIDSSWFICDDFVANRWSSYSVNEMIEKQ